MFCIVEQGGSQFKVAEGDTIEVPSLAAETGEEIRLDKVLLIAGDNGNRTVGTPYVEGAGVTARVSGHGKSDKVTVFKKKRRKDYKRTRGHRQGYTRLKITGISA